MKQNLQQMQKELAKKINTQLTFLSLTAQPNQQQPTSSQYARDHEWANKYLLTSNDYVKELKNHAAQLKEKSSTPISSDEFKQILQTAIKARKSGVNINDTLDSLAEDVNTAQTISQLYTELKKEGAPEKVKEVTQAQKHLENYYQYLETFTDYVLKSNPTTVQNFGSNRGYSTDIVLRLIQTYANDAITQRVNTNDALIQQYNTLTFNFVNIFKCKTPDDIHEHLKELVIEAELEKQTKEIELAEKAKETEREKMKTENEQKNPLASASHKTVDLDTNTQEDSSENFNTTNIKDALSKNEVEPSEEKNPEQTPAGQEKNQQIISNNESAGEAEQTTRNEVLKELRAYKNKIETKYKGAFNHGFRILKDSQAASRERNYKLAVKLIIKLESGESLSHVFNNESFDKIKQEANKAVKNKYSPRNKIRGAEIKKAIDIAKKWLEGDDETSQNSTAPKP